MRPVIESMPTHRVLRKKRLREALRPPPEVLTFWAGPPELSLSDRGAVLRCIRELLGGLGFDLVGAFGGTWRYRRAERSPVVVAAEEEAQADRGEHWWLSDLVWKHTETTFVARHDPDGNDLAFAAWGPDGQRVLEEVEKVLPTTKP
jgi:hypothetical protein